jgi:puromycin-sensitive aminopeptidase
MVHSPARTLPAWYREDMLRHRVFFFLFFACALVTAPWPAAAQRLPDTVVPERYTLWFAPDLDKETFRGRESIAVRLTTPARTITLHAAEITFDEATITTGGRSQTAKVSLDATGETATLTVPEELPAGAATIRITYTGILNDKLRGFYLSRANGRKYAVSQMEATDARRAFPSFDEPALKATFDISLLVDKGDTAISNGKLLSDTPGPEAGKHTLKFATTPKMSTYLVALIVGDFVCRTGSADRTPIRVCSTADKRPLTAFALEAAEQQVAFYNDYFGIPYGFGKLDLIAVPDFAAGAMENTGAITFRERLLLIDPMRASLDSRKRVAGIISHEIAHQWFGDLVTMKWWDDIWLNEGFATWIANKPLARWRPEWKIELDDASDTQSALGIDALRTTRAIRMHVETPDEINEVFDGIAYEKTAGVLRTVEAFVGPDVFRKGIAAYLRKYAYANAAGEDFWNEMTRVTGRPIDRIMKSYVEQAGAPVISVQDECTSAQRELTLEQERFVGTTNGTPGPSDQIWTVPVCLQGQWGGAPPRCEVLDQKRETVQIIGEFSPPGGKCVPIFANGESRGYYFTEYAPATVRRLAGLGKALKPVERISLLGDEWWMVRGGRHDIGVYLDAAAILASDETAAVTETIASRLSFTGEYLVPDPQRARFQLWIRERFGPVLAALGVPGNRADDDERQSRRAELLTLIGATGNDIDVQRRARELATQYIVDPRSLPGTLVPAVLRLAALGGDVMLYEQYLAQSRKHSADPEEYYRFFSALAWFQDPALVERTLNFALSPEVRTQDTGTLIAGLLGQPRSRDAAWRFVKAQWATLIQKLGTFQGIPGIIGALGSFCSEQAAMDIRQFFQKNPVLSSERSVRQTIERIEACAAVVDRQSPALTMWLANAVRTP